MVRPIKMSVLEETLKKACHETAMMMQQICVKVAGDSGRRSFTFDELRDAILKKYGDYTLDCWLTWVEDNGSIKLLRAMQASGWNVDRADMAGLTALAGTLKRAEFGRARELIKMGANVAVALKKTSQSMKDSIIRAMVDKFLRPKG